MKKIFVVLLSLTAIPMALAVGVGDTYEQVVAQKGPPSSKIEAGAVVLLNYPGQSIRMEHGKVAVVKTLSSTPTRSAPMATEPLPVVVPKKTPKASLPTEVTWSTDYAGALSQAKAQNRHVFLFFTGSDWCGWCKRLDHEILSTAEFNRFAGENLILVKLDFPQHTPLSPELKTQNDQLAHKYHVDGYPTVVVLDSSGRAVKRLGYQEGGPAPFVSTLTQLR